MQKPYTIIFLLKHLKINNWLLASRVFLFLQRQKPQEEAVYTAEAPDWSDEKDQRQEPKTKPWSLGLQGSDLSLIWFASGLLGQSN